MNERSAKGKEGCKQISKRREEREEEEGNEKFPLSSASDSWRHLSHTDGQQAKQKEEERKKQERKKKGVKNE